jgi:translation initiation factor IF-2
MGIRVYDISKKYGVENAVIIEKLHALGYKQVKQPSATIDKITAEYLIQELGLKEVVHAPPPPPPEPTPPPPPAPAPAAEPPPVAPVKAPATTVAPKPPIAPPVVAKAPTTTVAPPVKPPTVLHKTTPPVPVKPAAPAVMHPAQPAPVAPPKPPEPPKPPAPPEPPKPGTQVFDKPAAPASLGRMYIPPDRIIQMRSPVIVKDLALKLKLKPFQVISDLMSMGVFAKQNDAVEEDVAKRLCGKRGYFFELEKRDHHKPSIDKDKEKERKKEEEKEKEKENAEDLKPRPPVVTIMGHVDHGKTSLLDSIRKANVAAGEAGGITQHIGAYTVMIPSPHKERAGQLDQITFLDTPGHEAFTKMRARGANCTDIAVLVVAADDGIMPQTIESINHAKAAKVPIIVAINKIDVPGANPLKVKTQLQTHGLNAEDFGGDVICCEVSATKKLGIEKLLENILLQAEMMELKSNPKRKAIGIIIEAQLDPGAGSKATVLVRAGTLKQGDPIICGQFWGKVRAMYDDKGGKLKEALPATPARILGLNGVPEPGAELIVMPSEKEARDHAEQRTQAARAAGSAGEGRVATREALLEQFEAEKKKILKLVLKADAQGSLEAISGALNGIHSEKVDLEIIHTAVGAVSENDVLLASASKAVIIGFHVRLAPKASDLAKREGVEIKLYSIIYELIDQAKEAMAGLLEPLTREVITGHAEVRKVFEVSKGMVAGSMVTDGRIAHGARVRVLRRRAVQYEGFVSTLKRFQEDVKEVRAGLDCGIRLDNFQDFQPGDVVEAYTVEKVAQKL